MYYFIKWYFLAKPDVAMHTAPDAEKITEMETPVKNLLTTGNSPEQSFVLTAGTFLGVLFFKILS